MTTETNIRRCKVCNNFKEHTLNGTFPNGKDKKYIDNNGLQWNGRVCGSCHQVKSKETMRKLRNQCDTLS